MTRWNNAAVGVVLLGAAMASMVGCNQQEGPGHSTNRLAASCPAGQVPWDFGRFSNGLTSESLSQLGYATEDGGASLGETNTISVKEARCGYAVEGNNAGLIFTGTDVTTDIKLKCDGKKSCLHYPSMVDIDPQSDQFLFRICQNSYVSTRYTCGDDPLTVKKDFAHQMRCAGQSFTPHLACVPENCYGQTRRDPQLQCVPDLIKPIESKDGLTVNFDVIERQYLWDPFRDTQSAYGDVRSGQGNITFDDDQVYRFKGSVEVPGQQAPRQAVTLWLKSKVPVAESSVETLGFFRCSIGKIDLSKYTPTVTVQGTQRVDFDEALRLPSSCQDGAAFRAAARAAYLANHLAVPSPIAARSIETHLVASYDLENRAIVTTAATPLASTCNIKPLDFFYDYDAKVHNTFDYYSQNVVRVTHLRTVSDPPRVLFNAAPNTLIGAIEASVRKMEIKVNKAGRAHGEITADATFAMSGPDAAAWAAVLSSRRIYKDGFIFGSEYPKYLSLDGYFPGLERYASGLLPVPDASRRDSQGRVEVDLAGFIALPPPGLQAVFEGPLGEGGATTVLHIPITSALRTALFNPSAAHPLPVGGSQNYVLQLCPTTNVMAPYYNNDKGRVDTVEQAPVGGKLVLARNACVRTAVFSLIGENIVTPLPEVDLGDGNVSDLNPTTSGESRLSAQFDVDSDRQCVGTSCSTLTSQGLAGSGSPVSRTLLSVVSDEEEEDKSGHFSTELKMFGFDVISAAQDGQISEVETTISISPNYKAIAEAFHKPFPGFEIEEGHAAVGVNGLSLGFEYKLPLHFGPVQGDLVFGIGVGAGLGFSISHKYNPHVESSCATIGTDGGTVSDTCPDPNLALPSLPFRASRDLCYFLGGALVEPRTAAAVNGMRMAIPATEEVWVGAQVGNEYQDKSNCAASWNSDVCSNGHNTYMRWLSDAENFQVSKSFGAFERLGEPSSLGGSAVSAAALAVAKPVDSAVTLKNSAFAVRSMADAHRAVCVRPLIMSGQSHELKLAAELGFSAGFSLGFCTPSADFGVCIEGEVKLLDAKLEPEVGITLTTVKDNGGHSTSESTFKVDVPWSVSVLTGEVNIKLVTPFFDTGYTLLEYEGFKVAEGSLTSYENAFHKVAQ